MEFKDYYQTIGVQRDATQDDIKRAYRRLARKFHPDVSKESDAEARFKELAEAYAVLKDPDKRVAYDQLGARWQNGQDFQPPPDWAQGFEFREQDAGAEDLGEFSDFFAGLFGSRAQGMHAGATGRHDFHAHGADTHARILIDLEAAFEGATRSVTLRHSEMGPDGRPHIRERTLAVDIPKGVRAGQQIRLSGQGGAPMGQGTPGDLFLEIAFQPHPLYHVEGRDISLELPVAPWELALGAKIEVPTPAGAVELSIPEGSSPGRRMRLKGRGIPGRSPGDFYVVLRVVMPPADTEAAKVAWRQLQETLPFNPRADLGRSAP